VRLSSADREIFTLPPFACGSTASARPSLPGTTPIPRLRVKLTSTSPGRRHTADMVAELLLQGRPPRQELKPHHVIDHGEPARGERDTPAIDPRDMLAFGIHRLADLGAEAVAGERRLFGEKLPIEPGGARRRHLRLNREV
jgi:hypothetical protein